MCHLGFVDPMPTPEILAQLYESTQYHNKDRCAGDLTVLSPDQIEEKIAKENAFFAKYQSFLPLKGNALDVGCGWGTLVAFLRSKGYSAIGLEMSKLEADFASTRLKVPVTNAPIEELARIEVHNLDIVIMRHTLEHFFNPWQIILELKKKMNVHGVLIIEVPNYGSFDRLWYGSQWPGLAPYHLWYFTHKGISRLLTKVGFTVQILRPPLSEVIFGHVTNVWQKRVRSILTRLGLNTMFSHRNMSIVARPVQA